MTALNSFKGGMWNDEYLLGEGQYVYSENLDIYRDPRWIQLAVKPTNYKTGLADMVYIIGSAYGSVNTDTAPRNVYFALENKDIYDAEWTLRYDGSTLMPNDPRGTWRAFLSIPNSNGVAFLDYQWGAFIPYFVNTPAAASTWFRDNDAYSDDWSPYTLDMQAYWLVSNALTRPSYTKWPWVFTTDGDGHTQLLITSLTGGMSGGGAFWPWYPTITPYSQWIDQIWQVVFASVHSDSVWSGSTNGWRAYTELSALSVVPEKSGEGVIQLAVNRFSKILHWVNKNNTDILVAGDVLSYTYTYWTTSPSAAEYAQVYVYKHYGFGADSQQLIAKSRYYSNIETAFSNNGITFYLVGVYWLTDYNWANINDMIYCVSNKDNVGQIYAYGKTFAGAEDAWSVLITKNSSGKTMKRIGCLFRSPSKNWFYYSYEDEDGVFGVDYYDDITIDTPTSYQPSGKVFLRTDDAGDMSVNKEVLNLKVWCKVPENTTIIISYILDNSGTEIVYDTISHTTQGSTDYKIYRGNKPVKWFKCISWFVEMTTTGTTTPQLLNFNYDLWVIQN